MANTDKYNQVYLRVVKLERDTRMCPNCGNHTLEYFPVLKLWICSECEYNSPKPNLKEAEEGTFR